jgi:hypothetical protein
MSEESGQSPISNPEEALPNSLSASVVHSSEDEEDEEEEEEEMTEADRQFIVDDDQESDTSQMIRKRRRKAHQEQQQENHLHEDLEDDDLDLINENIGMSTTKKVGSKMTSNEKGF